MKFRLFSLKLKLKPGDHSDQRDWNNHTPDISVAQKDKPLFYNFGRIVKNADPVKTNPEIEMSNEEFDNETEKIIKEILTENIDAIAKELITGWSSRNNNNPEKKAIREYVTSSFNDLKKDHDKSRDQNKSCRVTTRRILYYGSAVAAIFTGIFVLIGSYSRAIGTEDLYSKYYEPFNMISSTTRGSDSDLERIKAGAVELYNKGKYNEAIAGFTEVLENNPGSYSTILFLGLAELAAGDTGSAVRSLEKVKLNQGPLSAEATWYLGLAYLKSGNKGKAADCFVNLIEDHGYYVREAGKILRRLK